MAVHDLLERYSVFAYENDAVEEIDQLFRHFATDSFVELRRSLVYVAAAEVALVRLVFGPVEGPIPVTGGEARIALANANCTPFSGVHGPRTAAEIRPWDVILFAGDMSKLQLLGYDDPAALRERLPDVVEALEARYRESPVSWGQELVDNGCVRLQALLWGARIALLLNLSGPRSRRKRGCQSWRRARRLSRGAARALIRPQPGSANGLFLLAANGRPL